MLIFAIFCLIINYNTIVGDCPPNSIPSHNTGDNFCFQLFPAELEFMKAELICNALNGNLVSICDVFTNEQLRSAASNSFPQYGDKDFWLGLMNNGNNTWNWTDPSIACPYRNWINGGPSNDGSCASVSISTGQWSSSNCAVSKPFICNVPKEVQKVDTCPYEYVYFDKTRFCYKKIFNYTFQEAILECRNEGANLTSIHSPEENLFLTIFSSIGYKVDQSETTWIGLTRSNNVWSWIDGTNFNYSSMVGFNSEYTNNCAYLWQDGWVGEFGGTYKESWENHYNCSLQNRVSICKMPSHN